MFSWLWQNGGGLFISGVATLTSTNVYENQAVFASAEEQGGMINIFALLEVERGGGLKISRTGAATLTNTNVYANRAGNVCTPF